MNNTHPKVSPKVWQAVWAMERDMCINDAYNVAQYGLTYVGASTIRAAARDLWGMGSPGSLAEFNRALAGEKVCLTYLHPDRIEAVKGALPRKGIRR